jgi:hypothetical protein
MNDAHMPVFTTKTMSFVMIVSDLLKPVRDWCSSQHRLTAMTTSHAVERALIVIVRG